MWIPQNRARADGRTRGGGVTVAMVVIRAMEITVNGVAREVPDGISVQGLVAHLGFTEGPVAVEVNREIVPRAQHGATALKGGDEVEVVHFVGGG